MNHCDEDKIAHKQFVKSCTYFSENTPLKTKYAHSATFDPVSDVLKLQIGIDCRPKMTLPPHSLGNFADIVFLEHSFLPRMRDVCTL